jgi:hypothetical protein
MNEELFNLLLTYDILVNHGLAPAISYSDLREKISTDENFVKALKVFEKEFIAE